MENVNELSPERMVQIKNLLKDIQVTSGNSSVIQDNKLLFVFKGDQYRIIMPNQLDLDGAEKAQNQLQLQLIQEEGNVTRRNLIKILKEKQNIDIKELEKDKNKYRQELQDALLELAVVSSDDHKKIEEIKLKKEKIEEKFMEVTIEVIEMLASCIEEQCKSQFYKFLAYSCTEKSNDNKEFQKVWNTFDNFLKDNSGLTYHALQGIQSLMLYIQG